ncbi:CPBP family intramembrane glutamic endopeptidase [Ktedonosporobacter rubrisoli]|nr:CPBP family intramembrane glutamic endopeptidase [Ktedonosporobacter rubrisoli]
MKIAGRIVLAILGPLVTVALFIMPVLLFHAYSWLKVAIYIGEISGALLLIGWYRKTTSLDFGLKIIGSWSGLLWCILYLFIRVAAWIVLIPQVRIETNWHILLIQAGFFLLLNAMGEEIHFRGLLFSSLSSGLWSRSVLIAAFVSSGIFALFHILDFLSSGWLWFFLIACDGLALCAIRIKTKSVFWSVLVHGILNLCTGSLFIGAQTVDDAVVYLYMAVVVIIDLLFFIFLFNQAHRQQEQAGALIPSQAS